MSRFPNRWTRAYQVIAVAALIVAGLGLLAPAAETTAKETAKGEAKVKKAKKARETLASLKTLSEAARNDADANAKAKLPTRPEKVVTSPSLTSKALDLLIDKHLAEAKVPEAAATTDVEFVRRVTLDLTGKLPTPEQVYNFVQTHEKDKRPKLIEFLLNSKSFAENLAHYWRDVIRFRATNPNGAQVGYDAFEDWIAAQIEKNRPWDEIARDIITARGRNDENGAVVLSLAHESQAVEMAGEVARIFMGVQIQCAQCHDHPTDSWKRQQFHEFASFFAGTKSKKVDKGANVFEVNAARGVPRYTMPDKEDPQKQIAVEPRFFLVKGAPKVPGLSVDDRRGLAASYVTGQDNPWFARAFINRVWYTLMGEAFYGPIDDLGPDREAKSPELLEPLAEAWAKGGYDIHWLYKTILNTRAYQREIRSTFTQAGRTPFASNCPSRLRSDQILDSLDQVLELHRGGGGGRGPAGKAAGKGAGKAAGKNAAAGLTKDLVATNGAAKKVGRGERDQFSVLYGVDPSTPNDDILGTIPQALFLMNSPQLNRAMSVGGNTVLGRILSSTPDNRQALLALYVRVFSRGPTPKEQQTCLRYIDLTGDRQTAFEDIFWSLLNSTEFITRR
jgi:Protein of unknown function (DUF1549)/Protein of unknown function (DUF1553)